VNEPISSSYFHGHGGDLGRHHGRTSDDCGHVIKKILKRCFIIKSGTIM